MPGWGITITQPTSGPAMDPPGHPGLFDMQERTVKAGTFLNLETSNWGVEWIIVAVTSGSLGLWPYLNSSPTGRPPWRFNANQPPVWLPVSSPGKNFAITALAQGDDDCDFSVTFVARANRGFDYTR